MTTISTLSPQFFIHLSVHPLSSAYKTKQNKTENSMDINILHDNISRWPQREQLSTGGSSFCAQIPKLTLVSCRLHNSSHRIPCDRRIQLNAATVWTEMLLLIEMFAFANIFFNSMSHQSFQHPTFNMLKSNEEIC